MVALTFNGYLGNKKPKNNIEDKQAGKHSENPPNYRVDSRIFSKAVKDPTYITLVGIAIQSTHGFILK
jgi:hypothetical protein